MAYLGKYQLVINCFLLCVFLSICVYVYLYMSAHLCFCLYVFVCFYLSVCVCAPVCVCVYVYGLCDVCASVCEDVCTCDVRDELPMLFPESCLPCVLRQSLLLTALELPG